MCSDVFLRFNVTLSLVFSLSLSLSLSMAKNASTNRQLTKQAYELHDSQPLSWILGRSGFGGHARGSAGIWESPI
uniref:Putative secreted protein n=1 Tax=Anopheles darlingi TaxID=43151 RepID=A0A2M4DF19_ANODA